MRRYRAHVMQLSRFGSVGAVNTLVGFSITTGLDVGLHVPQTLANACGFAAGMLCGFLLNRRFVFRSQAGARTTGPKYLLTVMVGFALNQAVLKVAAMILGAGVLQHMAAQLAGMGVYTVSVFLACRLWVFREPPVSIAAA